MSAAFDVVVVGGGPAGAAAACHLARGGRRVIVLEREARFVPRVCGEFLSPLALAELANLGLAHHPAAAATITGLRLIHGRSQARSALPFAACGLSREVLDEVLLAHAAQCGAEVRRGLAVRRVERGAGGWRAALADGTAVAAPALMLATGKHDLRGHQRPRPGAPLIGFKMHWRLAPAEAAALDRHIELAWLEGGYAGLQPVENGRANLCLVLQAGTYARLGRSWPRLLDHLREASPHLCARLAGAQPAWRRPATVAGMPYGYVHPDGEGEANLYRLGDQFAVIPSFTGEGMALALRTARLAAAAVLARQPAIAYGRAARPEVEGAIRNARLLERLLDHRLARQVMVPLGHLPGVLPALARATRLRVPLTPSAAAAG
jgi:menaquinone-9 beta-reductase